MSGTANVEASFESDKVVAHYGESDIRHRLDAALTAAGLGDRLLSPADLAPLDQFHTRGLAATVELAEACGIAPGAHVIDVGSGLGGPSRYLATKFDCRVEGVDLSPAFVEAATYLAERANLSSKVSYRCADALSLPYGEGSFDIAWTQHVAMNIADRARLYSEVHRVVRPGGRFAIYDVVAGNGEPVHFPVPWSRTAATSFLLTPEAMKSALETAGFKIAVWSDRTEAAVSWFAEQRKSRAQAAPTPPPVLGLHIAMGADFPALSANLGRNLTEGRVGLIQAIVERR